MSKKLAKIKAKYMSVLAQLKNELLQKYPSKADRIDYVVDVLMHKLYALKSHSLTDYIHTVYLASKEFAEFSKMMPSREEIEEILEEE
jgi:hypothetical protein